MRQKIEKILRQTPGLKARSIANLLGIDSKDVNALLYENTAVFVKDANFCWSLATLPEIRIELTEDSWVDCDSFEQALKNAGSPIDMDCSSVVFHIPKGCKILLDAAARLMALCNQLAWLRKTVTIDFSSCLTTLRYLNRMGFFDHLTNEVAVMPGRPKVSGATSYKGNNDKVVEFGAIDPIMPDETIPKQLKNSFVAHAGEKYSQPAFTVISELFGNVRDHSKSPILGFVALQCYKRSKIPHIQTVISDSGIGIVGTLRPILKMRYPELVKKFDLSDPATDAFLVKEVFQYGRITQSTDDGRGLGLKRSGDVAAKFSAKIAVRQETFEVKLHYLGGVLNNFSYVLDMPRILGTHICFDFLLDDL